jgi:prevent-host-death family protein
MRTIPASRFKAQCLAILDEVNQTRSRVLVTKRGKPVALVVPPEPAARGQRPLAGSVTIHGDITAPIDEPWEADKP